MPRKRHSDDERLRGHARSGHWQREQRFPYWKVQVWSDQQQAWIDIQKKHAEAHLALHIAEQKARKGKQARVMEVHRDSRAPMPGSERRGAQKGEAA